MPRKMAVTHADLEPSPTRTDLGSKTGAFIIVLTILLGFSCFVLCLIAEATRSEATYRGDRKEGTSECVYSGSGKVPLLCCSCAFIVLAIAMVMEHAYMLIAISKSSTLVSWEPDSSSARSIAWQAGFLFISTWMCFAGGEILLLAGVSVESGHLKKWSDPRITCIVLKQGLLSAAGVLALTTVFLGTALYLVALRAQTLSQQQHNVQQHLIHSSLLYASPPSSPHLTPIHRENPNNHNHDHLLSVFPTPFIKTSSSSTTM